MNILIGIWTLAVAASLLAEAGTRPNVVIIYGDDVGIGDVGIYGAEKIPTPNIDRLARGGLLFTDGHSGAATCTPSRYSILTGHAAFRAGASILPGDARMAISPDQFTLPDLFKRARYATAAIGKWHLGLGDGETPIDWNGEVKPGPQDIGFDYSFILPATNDRVPCVYLRNRRIVNLDPTDPLKVDYKNKLTDTYPDAKEHPEAMTVYKSIYGHNFSVINGIGRIGWMSGGRSALWDDEMMTEELVKEAKGFISRNRQQPFFLYYAAQNIHVPRVPHPRFHGESGLGPRGDSMVEFDWMTGEILQFLDDMGLRENTIVIFSSDNGPVYNDGYDDGTTVERSWAEVDNGHDASGIYRGGKYQIYEGGTRVPFIISWPGVIEPGVSHGLISQLDLLASFADLLDVPLPEDAGFDSRNMLPLLLGRTKESPGHILEEAFADIAVRRGSLKYIPARTDRLTGKPLPAELYHLADDPGEQINLAETRPEQAQELEALLKKLIEKGAAVRQ